MVPKDLLRAYAIKKKQFIMVVATFPGAVMEDNLHALVVVLPVVEHWKNIHIIMTVQRELVKMNLAVDIVLVSIIISVIH